MNTLLTITGPSLSGKSTLENMLHQKYGLEKITSFTTRPPREGEVSGKDYHFLKEDEARRRIEDGEMAEWVEFKGHLYGILGSELEQKLKKNSCIAVVEPRGLLQMNEYAKDNDIKHRAIYVSNPPVVLAARFLKRFQDNPQSKPIDLASRMVSMLGEEQEWVHAFYYHFMVNVFDSTNQYEVVDTIYFGLRLDEASR